MNVETVYNCGGVNEITYTAPHVRSQLRMPHRIIFDGLNLSLAQGTGIATYTRMLTRVARDLGHDIGVVYSSSHAPSKNLVLREIDFFDEARRVRKSVPERVAENLGYVLDQIRYHGAVRPKPVDLSGVVITRQFA